MAFLLLETMFRSRLFDQTGSNDSALKTSDQCAFTTWSDRRFRNMER